MIAALELVTVLVVLATESVTSSAWDGRRLR